jgi:hypothetical protein
MKESDLYLPLKRLLESQHYEVKAEVHDCDVLAVRGEEAPVVVELKVALNLDVILQAVERLSLTPNVYIGIPAECAAFKRRRKHTIKLLRMLGLGLVVIQSKRGTGSATVLLDPGMYVPRKSKPRQRRLLGEFARRVGDPNLGGMASRVAEALREPKARDFLYRDVYGWFDRASPGVYDLSPRGRREIAEWQVGVAGADSDALPTPAAAQLNR